MPNQVSRETVESLKLQYEPGMRVVLDEDMYDPNGVQAGVMGTVSHVDDIGTIHVKWDDGKSLGLIHRLDAFHIL